jgi:hypothetical protein
VVRHLRFPGDRDDDLVPALADALDTAADGVRSATVAAVPDTNDGEPRFNGHLTIAGSKGRRLDASARAALAGIPLAATFEVDCLDQRITQLETGTSGQ